MAEGKPAGDLEVDRHADGSLGGGQGAHKDQEGSDRVHQRTLQAHSVLSEGDPPYFRLVTLLSCIVFVSP